MIGKVAPRSHCLVVLALLGLVATAMVAVPPDGHTPLLRGLEEVESDHTVLCPAIGGQEDLGRTVARLADQTRAEIVSGSSGSASVEVLNRLVFTRLGIRGCRSSMASALPLKARLLMLLDCSMKNSSQTDTVKRTTTVCARAKPVFPGPSPTIAIFSMQNPGAIRMRPAVSWAAKPG